MNLFKKIVAFQPRRLLNIRGKLIGFTSFFILFLIMINFVLFYISTDRNYIEQLEISNESLVKQIGSSYELVIKYITNSVYKTALYDMDLLDLVQNYNNGLEHQNSIYANLESIMLFNEYIQSVYLYLPQYNQVFSTSNSPKKISPFESFSDRVAFSMIDERTLYSLDPRIIEFNDAKKQVLTIVSSVPLYGQRNLGYLVVNVNMDQLRYNLLVKLKRNQNMNFFVVDSHNVIIITENIDNRLGTVLDEEPINRISNRGFPSNLFNNETIITTVFHSDSLKWKFILETTFDTTKNYLSKIIWFITISIFLVIISIFVIITVFSVFTRPVNKMAAKYSEKLWKDFITDDSYLTNDMKATLFSGWSGINNAKYGIIVLRIEEKTLSDDILTYYETLLNEIVHPPIKSSICKGKVVITSKDMIAVIQCYNNMPTNKLCAEKQLELAETIYNRITPISRPFVYLGIGTIKEHFSMLPFSYKECLEMYKYKLSFNSHILPFSAIKEREGLYEYPYLLEKQLINNLMAGNTKACLSILSDFFSLFTQPGVKIEDSEIRNSIYYLENSILKHISGLSISLNEATDINISNGKSLDKIETLVSSGIEKICCAINEREHNAKYKCHSMVLDYIENNYIKFDISLNKIADDLNLSRNKISKIIKGATGKNFTDYINEKRIALAKDLMQDKDKTIEDIAKVIGYNYSYYFIKVFKSIEGVTPGQYYNNIGNISL